MKEHKITVAINRPIDVVFEFSINPANTPKWIDTFVEEQADSFPPKIGTKYRNHTKDSDWSEYIVVEFEHNKTFTLSDLNKNYHVRYSYRTLPDGSTELVYHEWMENGDLKKPFPEKFLECLKQVLEASEQFQ